MALCRIEALGHGFVVLCLPTAVTSQRSPVSPVTDVSRNTVVLVRAYTEEQPV